MENLLTKELSAKLKVGQSMIYRWVNLEQIPYVRIVGVVRFREEAIRRWLRKKEHTCREPFSGQYL